MRKTESSIAGLNKTGTKLGVGDGEDEFSRVDRADQIST
jgi:hypothetical protein